VNHSARFVPYLYVAPLVALLLFVFGYPLVRIFEFSFKMVRGIDGPWIGWRNYDLVLSQPLFWESVQHNMLLLVAVPFMVGWSLLIAVVLYERLKGWKLYRVVLFLPYILAIPIIAVIMKKIFQFNGPVNEVLRWLSLDFLALDWIGSSDVALWTVMMLIIWRESALGIILFLARLLSLDESLIESAKPPAWRLISESVPMLIIWPRWMMARRSDTSSATLSECVESKIAIPALA